MRSTILPFKPTPRAPLSARPMRTVSRSSDVEDRYTRIVNNLEIVAQQYPHGLRVVDGLLGQIVVENRRRAEF